MSGRKVLTSPALGRGSTAVLGVLIGTLLSAVEHAEEHRPVGLLLVVHVPPLLTLLLFVQLLSIDAGSVTLRCGQKPMFPQVSGALHLGKRWAAPGKKRIVRDGQKALYL